jgi:GT2 family glycosyltransferase
LNARPSVSAIIATHNRAELVSEALDSIFAQQGLGKQFDVEVVVVDDASTDNTPQVVARYPEVRFIRFAVNRGQAAARNAGINSSSGTYVAFLDDDDVWLPGKLSSQVAALEAHPEAGVAYSQFIITSATPKSKYAKGSAPRGLLFPERSAPSGSVFQRLLFVNLCGIPASPLVRREALTRVGGFDESALTAEDYDLWLRLAFHVPFLFVPGAVAVYRRTDDGNLISSVRRGRYEPVLRLVIERALALLPDTEETGPLKQQVRATCDLRLAVLLTGRAEGWEHLRAGVTIWPGLALNPGNRPSIAHIIAADAANSDSPNDAVKRRWGEISDLQRELGRRERVEMRRLLAAAYWQAGVIQGKGIDRPANAPNAARAIVRSIMLDPVVLRNWGALLGFVVRRSFGLRTP